MMALCSLDRICGFLFTGLGKNSFSLFQVYAISHTLPSEPHVSFKAVYPNPIRNLTIARVIDNKITLAWLPPQESLYTGYVIRFGLDAI